MAFWKKKSEEEQEHSNPSSNEVSASNSPQAEKSLGSKAGEPTVLSGADSTESNAAKSNAAGSGATASKPGEVPATSRHSSSDPIENRFGVVRSALGPGTVIQGKLSFDTPVRIDGKLTGDIFSSQALIVGDEGEIDATVEVATLIVMGKVSGKIKATERVELWAGGFLSGEITTPVFMMEDTAVFNGKCAMGASAGKVAKSSTKSESQGGAEKDQKEENRAADGGKEDESHKEIRVH